MRARLIKLHAFAAAFALVLILTFFTSSLWVEVFGDQQQVVWVKNSIFYAIWLLLPAMALTGATGFKLAPKATKGLVGQKKFRMPFIAANGLLILMPAAIYLRYLALDSQFGTTFYLVQGLELVAGLCNIVLMSLNFRDGLALSRGRVNKAR